MNGFSRLASGLVGVTCAVALGLSGGGVAGAATPKVTVKPGTTHVVKNPSRERTSILPTRAAWARGVRSDGKWHAQATAPALGGQVSYHGGIDSIGVVTGQPKVYLVFWGSQWGAGTNVGGKLSLAHDPSNEAGILQDLFAGLGTSGEQWSGVMTQYCEAVAIAATSCPTSNMAHVAYPTGGALAGVWLDNASAAPSAATGNQLAKEANIAAAHFGNTTQAANRNANYFILSPTGTNPDGFNTSGGDFCAWHSFVGATDLSGGPASMPYGDVTFTNMGYTTDAGASCGADYVNPAPAGATDGISLTASHEYAEFLTDPLPGGGWFDAAGNEVSDKCAWDGVGGSSGAQDVALSTGTFPLVATWSNGAMGCAIAEPVVSNPATPSTITVTDPGAQTATVGTAFSLQVQATDSATATMSYAATGLPSALSIDPSSGLISGTPDTAGTSWVTVDVTDTAGSTSSASFSLVVAAAPSTSCTSSGSGGDQDGDGDGSGSTGGFGGWGPPVRSPGNGSSSFNEGYGRHRNAGLAQAGPGRRHGGWQSGSVINLPNFVAGTSSTTNQTIVLPANCATYSLRYFWVVATASSASTQDATMTLSIGSTVLASYSNLNANPGVGLAQIDLGQWAGQSVQLAITVTESNPTAPTVFALVAPSVKIS